MKSNSEPKKSFLLLSNSARDRNKSRRNFRSFSLYQSHFREIKCHKKTISQNAKVTPNLDKKSTNTFNLTVLQRIDPFVNEIIITVSHVTFYEFNVDSEKWSKKNVEGSLFVVKRDTNPRFQFIVMNRKNTENLVENLLEDFEYEVQLPYILYRNASQDVNGIWFYDDHECEKVANLLNRIHNSYSKVPTTKSKVPPNKSKFEELEAVLSPSVIDGPLEPSCLSINTKNPDIQDDPSFINSFNTALNIGGAPNATVSGQPYNSIATVVSTSKPQGVSRPTLPTIQMPSNLSASRSIMSIFETSEPDTKYSTDLVTPSLFSPVPSPSPLTVHPISPSMLTAPPLNNSPVNMQRMHGAPLLRSFPPPTPPLSLIPTSLTTPFYGQHVLSREKVREALQLLIQDNQFIDIVYRAVMNVHQS